MKNKHFVFTLLIGLTPVAYGATGDLTVFDDADENGFNHNFAACTGDSAFNFTSPVHSGSKSAGVKKNVDNSGAGWTAPVTYSADSDYDGINFWFNAGSAATTLTSLAVFDGNGGTHFAHLEDAYGGPIPANMWVQFQIGFASPLFQTAQSTSPTTILTVCVINHNQGGNGDFFYLDDVALTGADIFKNGFDPN